jgi:peptidoglycan-associated lipoprotein
MKRSFRVCGAALVALTMAVGACGKKPAPPPPQMPAPPPPTQSEATRPPAPPAPATPPPTATRTPTEDEEFASMTLDDLNRKGLAAPVFFALDSSELSDEAKGVIQKNVEFLKRRPSTKVMIEGHCDSRGTAEYNLALGERRADAVRDYLQGLGVAADRVTIVSKGKEQPFCSEETESCWQQNRRGHFVFTAK